jgi:hypothetical protein
LRGQNSRIVGDMADGGADLLRYEPAAELRGISVEGLRLAFAGKGRDALVFAGGAIGVIGNVVSRCVIAGGPNGYALRLAGAGNQFNVVRECTLTGSGRATGAVHIGSADGNKLLDNVIAGVGAGVRIELVNGAYKTAIVGGAIVSRDGGVHILAGQQVDIERVQFEQGGGNFGTDDNLGPSKSHVVVAGSGVFPRGEEVRDVRIVACNFGSGTHQAAAITLAGHARDVLIDENYFAALGTAGIDIVVADPSVLWTRIGPNNRVGGIREGIVRGAANGADPRDLLRVADRGTGSYGVRKDQAALGLASGWTAAPAFAFWKTEDDTLRFRSGLKAGAVTPGAPIGRLPDGFRPQSNQRALLPTDGDDTAVIAIDTGGTITVRRVPAGATVLFDQLALPIAGRSSYLSGPY